MIGAFIRFGTGHDRGMRQKLKEFEKASAPGIEPGSGP